MLYVKLLLVYFIIGALIALAANKSLWSSVVRRCGQIQELHGREKTVFVVANFVIVFGWLYLALEALAKFIFKNF